MGIERCAPLQLPSIICAFLPVLLLPTYLHLAASSRHPQLFDGLMHWCALLLPYGRKIVGALAQFLLC